MFKSFGKSPKIEFQKIQSIPKLEENRPAPIHNFLPYMQKTPSNYINCKNKDNQQVKRINFSILSSTLIKFFSQTLLTDLDLQLNSHEKTLLTCVLRKKGLVLTSLDITKEKLNILMFKQIIKKKTTISSSFYQRL